MIQTKHFSDYCLSHISYEFFVKTPGNFISVLIDLGIFLNKKLQKKNNNKNKNKKKIKTKNEKLRKKRDLLQMTFVTLKMHLSVK